MDGAWTWRFQAGIGELIETVGGTPAKAKEGLALLMEWKDEVINLFASQREFQVLLKANLAEEENEDVA